VLLAVTGGVARRGVGNYYFLFDCMVLALAIYFIFLFPPFVGFVVSAATVSGFIRHQTAKLNQLVRLRGA